MNSSSVQIISVRAEIAGTRGLVDPAVRRRPQLKGLQVRIAQQTFDTGRDLVRKIYDRARTFRTEEGHAADDGSAGPHVAAAYGTREDQNVSVALLHSHGSIILILLEKAIDSSSRTITMSEGASS